MPRPSWRGIGGDLQMSKLETVRSNTGHLLDRALTVLDKAILMIPEGQLEFRPTPENMTVKQLSYHIYQTVYILTRSTSMGQFRLDLLQGIPFDPDAVKTPQDIVDYGAEVKRYVRDALADFTEEDLDRMLKEDWEMTGYRAMNIAFEEVIHHRGQLMTYLRLMGVEPPYLYDYS
jgi:uncharacterized damage-inducible protein DinB